MRHIAQEADKPVRTSVPAGTDSAHLLGELRRAAREHGTHADSHTAVNELAAACALRTAAAYWRTLCGLHGAAQSLRRPPDLTKVTKLSAHLAASADCLGRCIAQDAPENAAHTLGAVYSTLLSDARRRETGSFYTPPALAVELLRQAKRAGADLTRHRVLDPACGAGIFLVLAARDICAGEGTPEEKLRAVETRLCGMDIDPVAAWLAQVCVEASLMAVTVDTGRRLRQLVDVRDALTSAPVPKADLVIGNPPYGRRVLPEEMRTRFARSLYGHANLYGVFTDLAVRCCAPGGVVAFVTPTSFLGGQYFQALRTVLTEEAPPAAIDFIDTRTGVFDGALQEACLAVFRRVSDPPPTGAGQVRVGLLSKESEELVRRRPLGAFTVARLGAPWILPRETGHEAVIRAVTGMPDRLKDHGLRVATGPLVWNRHVRQFTESAHGGAVPVIWSDAVSTDGVHPERVSARRARFIRVDRTQNHLLLQTEAVLVQRTTAKEQRRRLVCAVLNPDPLLRTRGVVIENHLNMILRVGDDSVHLGAVCAVLNSRGADAAYRCISGSVAVSAYELCALPMPSARQMRQIAEMQHAGITAGEIDTHISRLYGL